MKKLYFWGKRLSLATLTLMLGLLLLASCSKQPTDTPVPSAPVYTLNKDNASYTLSSVGTGDETELRVPATYQGLPVTAIGSYAAAGNTRLRNVILPSGVTVIGHRAFGDCTALESISVSESVQKISDRAFEGCSSLRTVEFASESTLTEIGKYAFRDCTSLTAIRLPSSLSVIGHRAFSDCTALVGVELPADSQLTVIESHAFYNNFSLQSFLIPATLTRIEDYTFYACVSLAELHYADQTSLSFIGSYAFQKCSNLTSLTLPETLQAIGLNSFAGCHKLVELIDHAPAIEPKIGDTNTNGGVAYYAREVHDGETKLKTQDGFVFYTVGNTHYLMRGVSPESVLQLPKSYGGRDYIIHPYAFYKNTVVTSVDIPAAVTNIGANAFAGCTALTSVKLTDQIAGVAVSAFDNCKNLRFQQFDNALYLGNSENPYAVLIKGLHYGIESCTIHTDTALIAAGAFRNCDLTEIVIPKNMRGIGTQAFYECNQLKSLTFEADSRCTLIGSSAFYNCFSLQSAQIPARVASLPTSLFSSCTELKNIHFDGTITEWEKLSKATGWDEATPTYTVTCKNGTVQKPTEEKS